MDKDIAMKHSLELIRKVHPIPMEIIDGQLLCFGKCDGKNITFGSNVRISSDSCCFQYHSMLYKSNGTRSSMV